MLEDMSMWVGTARDMSGLRIDQLMANIAASEAPAQEPLVQIRAGCG
jgi:hypothetical protein